MPMPAVRVNVQKKGHGTDLCGFLLAGDH